MAITECEHCGATTDTDETIDPIPALRDAVVEAVERQLRECVCGCNACLDLVEAFDALAEVVKRSEHAWHWKKLREYAAALFERGPFKVGDKVRLLKTPRIDNEHSWGWLRAKHFMVEGALATVRTVDFSDGHFCALVVFDDETYLSSMTGKTSPVDREGLYHMWDTMIERAVDARPTPAPAGGKGGK